MKIAFLILCHTDKQHINRLATKLSNCKFFDVFIHVDKKVNIDSFKEDFNLNEKITFIEDRYNISWGGYSAIEATMALIKSAKTKDKYDRYVLLQGLDYPLKSNQQIINFFEDNKDIEFIRGCNISSSNEKYFYSRTRYYLFYENINIFKKIINKVSFLLDLRIKNGYIFEDKKYAVYWGCAQWALTAECINYILDFYHDHKKFSIKFKYMFPVDELYFHTIIFNSHFSKNTLRKGPEPCKVGLVNWRNLHYFEYKDLIKVFNDSDFEFLIKREELFCRKVTTISSSKLLDMIDNYHQTNI